MLQFRSEYSTAEYLNLGEGPYFMISDSTSQPNFFIPKESFRHSMWFSNVKATLAYISNKL